MCDAVAYAHSRGVVHGGLRPEAIIVGRFGEVFVEHWGTAKILDALDPHTSPIQAPASGGQPPLSRFSAPEQASEAFEEIDPRTDVHALGGILYLLLTLRDANCGESGAELLEQALLPRVPPAQRLSGQEPLPHWPGGRMPACLAAAAMKALSLAREDRHATVCELQKDIAAWQEGAAAMGATGHAAECGGLTGMALR